jgi:hypothetical protein
VSEAGMCPAVGRVLSLHEWSFVSSEIEVSFRVSVQIEYGVMEQSSRLCASWPRHSLLSLRARKACSSGAARGVYRAGTGNLQIHDLSPGDGTPQAVASAQA